MKALFGFGVFVYWVVACFSHVLAVLRMNARRVLRPGKAFAPVTGEEWVSIEWLREEVLLKYGLIDAQTLVVGAQLAGIDYFGNRGLSGVTRKIVLTYERGCSSAKTPPSSFIIKRSPHSITGRRNLYASGQIREPLFYASSLADSIPHGGIPKVYYSYASAWLNEFVIIMEDLSCRNATGVNMVFGNQLWGIPKPLDRQRDVVQLLSRIYLQAAAIHATHWRDKSLFQKRWLRASKWYKGGGRLQWELAIQRGFNSWQIAKRNVAEGRCKAKFSPKIVSIIDQSYKATSWQALQEYLSDPIVPWTLCHGDFHAGNMLLIDDGKSKEELITMCDWAEVGIWEPTSDLAQTIISDIKPNIFGEHCHDLVLAYWRRLIELGVSKEEYPFEQCWSSFCRGGIERWIWLFSVLASFPGLPDNIVQYFHDQLAAFIEFYGTQPYYQLKSVVCIV